MQTSVWLIAAGRPQRRPGAFAWPSTARDSHAEYWVDIADAIAGDLREFLAPLALHPLLMAHCLDQVNSPGVLVYDDWLLMEYPSAFSPATAEPAYLSMLLHSPYLITVRHGSLPALDDLMAELDNSQAPVVHHLVQVMYQIIDRFTDLNVDAETAIRDQLLELARSLADSPATFDAKRLAQLRWQVGNLVSLAENQLYCASSLAALDLKELQEPHRKAYIQDIVTEAEITQRGVYRLEARLADLYSDYQMVGADRVERRLRLLTIVSAITLPLGLIAGLLGMNVGGVPGIDNPSGFMIVVVLMLLIGLVLFVLFRRRGWFD
jgi:Mg2+ and Co2+ transporter CorA